MERIHVVGVSPRTGTTLIAECMCACFEIDAFEEHESPLDKHRHNVRVYLTKNPRDLHIVGPRQRLDRHFHVIAMVRDPRDIIASVHRRRPGRYWAPLRFWKERIGIVRRLAQHKRFILIRYEDLVRSPDLVQDELTRRMPFLRKKALFSEFHQIASPATKSLRALGPLRAIEPNSIGNWRNHLPRIKGQIARHGSISQDLIDFGYERDEEWLSILQDVDADLARSRFPEQAPFPHWEHFRRKYAEAGRILALRLLRIDQG